MAITAAVIGAGASIWSNRQANKRASQMNSRNSALYDSGINLSNEGVDATRRLGDSYEQMLSSGSVLPDSTTSVLKRARGAISDRNTRDTMASAARLRQARVASGGRLSPEAAQEYLRQAEADANRAAQDASLGLDTEEAQLQLSETNNLRDRLERARAAILGEGRARWTVGNGGQNAASLQSSSNDLQLAQILAGLGSTVYSNRTSPTRLPTGTGT